MYQAHRSWVLDLQSARSYVYTCTQTCANSCKEIHCKHIIFGGNYANIKRLELIFVVLSQFPQSHLEFCPCMQFLFTMKILSQASGDNQFISPFSLCSEAWDNVGIGGFIQYKNGIICTIENVSSAKPINSLTNLFQRSL